MAEHMNLYEKARYYDVVFDRDVSDEIEFLIGVFQEHGGEKPESVLELACGPGYHARAFAARGLRAAGVDLGGEMIRLAREKAAQDDVEVEWFVADMRDFELDTPVELAFTMFDGIDALLSNESLIQHLLSVGRNLSAGGLYLIDLTHPRDCSYSYYGDFRYQGEREGVRVEIEWAVNEPAYDLVTGVAEVEIEMRVEEQGERQVVRDRAQERVLMPQEIQLLARLSKSFEVVAWYGDYDLRQPLDRSPKSRRMIAALQRTE